MKIGYDGISCIEERKVNAGNEELIFHYVNGIRIDEVINMFHFFGASGAEWYYHYDGKGWVIALTEGSESGQTPGEVHRRYEYTPYGVTSIFDDAYDSIAEADAFDVTDNTLAYNRTLYAGREYDPETNLYYYRARHYSPETGRFIQRDPIGYGDRLGLMNLYCYVGNNPVNKLDPFGLVTISISGQRHKAVVNKNEDPNGDLYSYTKDGEYDLIDLAAEWIVNYKGKNGISGARNAEDLIDIIISKMTEIRKTEGKNAKIDTIYWLGHCRSGKLNLTPRVDEDLGKELGNVKEEKLKCLHDLFSDKVKFYGYQCFLTAKGGERNSEYSNVAYSVNVIRKLIGENKTLSFTAASVPISYNQKDTKEDPINNPNLITTTYSLFAMTALSKTPWNSINVPANAEEINSAYIKKHMTNVEHIIYSDFLDKK